MTHPNVRVTLLALALLGLAGTMVALGTPTQAAPGVAAPRATPVRPPTPTLPPPPSSPTPSSPTPSSGSSNAEAGGLIWLWVHFEGPAAPTAVLTVVQWQDAAGAWHDVEGWRGSLDEVTGNLGRKVWWVPARLFERGPFRWVLYDTDGYRVAQSAPFALPRYGGHVVSVSLGLER